MTKVLQVYKTYQPGSFTGVERVIWEIAEGSAPLGIEHRVLALAAREVESPLTVGSHRAYLARQDINIASSGFSLSAFGLYRELWDWADVVHFHYPWPMMDLLYLSRGARRRKPSMVTYHSDIVRQKMLGKLYVPVRNQFLRGMDRIVATSPNYVKSSAVLQRYRDKVSVIPIGLSERQVPDGALVASWRARVGAGFFLFVGAARYYKGLPYLIEAARLTGLTVVLAGEFRPEEIGGPIPPNVTIIGKVDDADKEALLTLSCALVLPSHLRSEAYGLVLIEAARAGKPMISCRIGTGTSFVNRDGETGLEVEPANVAALAEAMRTLAGDDALVSRLGDAARARFERHLTAAKMAGAYSALYRELYGDR